MVNHIKKNSCLLLRLLHYHKNDDVDDVLFNVQANLTEASA